MSPPAARLRRAGIKPGDIIIEFEGKTDQGNERPAPVVAAVPVGKVVEVKVLREGQPQVFKVQIQEMEIKKWPPRVLSLKSPWESMPREFTPELARRLEDGL